MVLAALNLLMMMMMMMMTYLCEAACEANHLMTVAEANLFARMLLASPYVSRRLIILGTDICAAPSPRSVIFNHR